MANTVDPGAGLNCLHDEKFFLLYADNVDHVDKDHQCSLLLIDV